jgi:hypothetical protein
MSGAEFSIDYSEIKALEMTMLAFVNKLDRVTAVAMTRSAKVAQARVIQETPKYITNPTRWTLNGTFVRPATEANLSVDVGFKDYANSGTPAAKYLQLQAAGGGARHKGYEKLLQRKGHLRSYEYAVPTGNAPLKFNTYGNVSSGGYVQVLSRLGSLREVGSEGNATDSARSQSKRKQADYFVAEINGHRAIWARKGQRGIVPVFHFVSSQPQFKARFPVAEILQSSFASAFNTELRRAVDEQLRYNKRK